MKMDFTVSSNWKNIFRSMKWLGLMYSVEANECGYTVSVDGPLSIFKMTDRYGTSLAKLLPEIIAADSWSIRADIIGKQKTRIFVFELRSDEINNIMEDIKLREDSLYDSIVEEKFANNFKACGTGWELKREPEPLLSGRHILIPDFSFEKFGIKVYLEIVGYWTSEYLERKIAKLSTLSNIDILVVVNEDLACAKIQHLKGPVIYYSKNVPLKPVIDHLRMREEVIIGTQKNNLLKNGIQLKGDIVTVEEIAVTHGVSKDSVRRALQSVDTKGYIRIGEYYVKSEKAEELKEMIGKLGEAKLSEAVGVIEAFGLKDPQQVLEHLGYTIIWKGLDYESSRIKKVT